MKKKSYTCLLCGAVYDKKDWDISYIWIHIVRKDKWYRKIMNIH